MARLVALFAAVAGLVCGLIGSLQLPDPRGILTLVQVPWIPSIKAEYHLAADGISLTLVLLTGVAAVAGMFTTEVAEALEVLFMQHLNRLPLILLTP